MIMHRQERLSGWGQYHPISCETVRPTRFEDCRTVLSESSGPILTRGLGRSYGDSAVLSDGPVMLGTGLNRMLSFDKTTGLLHTEAGASLGEIINAVLPHGWFLPTTPGTKYVTVGGAIAADVHGKNHHADGTFGTWVREFTLLLADGSLRRCTPEENTPLFWATIGGMGLTGHIADVLIQMKSCPSAYYQVSYRRAGNLGAILELLESTGDQYPYSVGWIDCLASGSRLGRSVLMLGQDAELDALSPTQREEPFRLAGPPRKSVPFPFPSFALNAWSVRAFNELYYARHGNREEVAHYDTYFYPLDSILHWNRIYGRRGFVQYQALFPPHTAEEGLRLVLETLGRYGLASFLAVIKRSGPANPAPLSYLSEGYTLALDIPNTGDRLLKMTRELDAILLERDGRLYLAKDSLMDAATFAAMYPRKDEFLAIKRDVDPNNRFTSEQARRLALTP